MLLVEVTRWSGPVLPLSIVAIVVMRAVPHHRYFAEPVPVACVPDRISETGTVPVWLA